MKKLGLLFLILLASFGLFLSGSAPKAHAAFNQNRIIDDPIFDNVNSFGVDKTTAIQHINDFLNTFSGSCISQNSGFSAPDPTGYSPNGGYTYGGNVSAGQVIYDASVAYGLNPQVMLATLQKEEGLVRGNGPYGCSTLAISAAVGYGCPDSQNLYDYSGVNLYTRNGQNFTSISQICVNSSSKVGFSQQIVHAAWLFKFGEQRSKGNINWNVQLNNAPQPGDHWDNSDDPQSCYSGPMTQGNWQVCPSGSTTFYDGYRTIDGTAVHMDTGATASLYWYTPHFHGNQVFSDTFTGWFGPTSSIYSAVTVAIIQQPDPSPARGQTITYKVSFTNTLSIPLTFDSVGAVGRAGGDINAGINRDFGWQGPVTLQAGASQQFTFTTKILDLGTMYIWPAILYQGNYVQYNNWGSTIVSHSPNFSVSGLTFSNTNPAKGETLSASFTVTNNLPVAIDVDGVGVVGRFGNFTGPNRDIGWQGITHFNANETKSFTGPVFSRTITDIGTHYYWIGIQQSGNYIQYNNWGSTIVSHIPNLSLSQPLTINATNVYAGQDVTFSAKLKNNESHPINYDAIGIPVKFYDRYSYDAVWVGPGVVASGAEITLSGTRNIDKPGPYTYWVANYFGGTYSTIDSIKKFSALEVAPNFSVSGLTFSNTNPAKGETLSASFTVTNNLPVAIDVDGVGVVGRFGNFTGPNRDIGWQGITHFNANETKSFTGPVFSRTITDIGTHYYWIGILYKGNYIQYNNWGSTIVSHG